MSVSSFGWLAERGVKYGEFGPISSSPNSRNSSGWLIFHIPSVRMSPLGMALWSASGSFAVLAATDDVLCDLWSDYRVGVVPVDEKPAAGFPAHLVI